MLCRLENTFGKATKKSFLFNRFVFSPNSEMYLIWEYIPPVLLNAGRIRLSLDFQTLASLKTDPFSERTAACNTYLTTGLEGFLMAKLVFLVPTNAMEPNNC